MEIMKRVANKHGLACLLHEKPFAGVNGSGKHNNWSLSTNTGVNLLEPGDSPIENAQFLTFLVAVIKAVDEYQGILRACVASAGNDHRLGANEAPPAIVSIFLGEELQEVLDTIEYGKSDTCDKNFIMNIGVDILPKFKKDTTDRNRTSPFAFTGNKFEFRMLGSTFSVSGPNVVINTIVAEALSSFADVLEKSTDFSKDLQNLIKKTIIDHKRIIFNGNNYSDEWVAEAEKRGLLNLKTAAEANLAYNEQKNIDVFVKHNIFTASELHSRYEIFMEGYCKTLNIEALTMVDMVNKYIIPSVLAYSNDLGKSIVQKKAVSSAINCEMEESLLTKISDLSATLYNRNEKLSQDLLKVKDYTDITEEAFYYKDVIFVDMQELRAVADELETIVGEEYWAYPTYGKLLFGVN